MVAASADQVTPDAKRARDELMDLRPSTLPFDPKGMLALRVTRAQFARMCGVSKQSVSVWVRKGWVNIGPDGRFDPSAAARQLMQRADPSRLRARLFREAMAPLGALHARIQSLETEVATERQRAAALADELAQFGRQSLSCDELATRISHFIRRLEAEASHYLQAHLQGSGGEWLDLLTAEVLLEVDEKVLVETRALYLEAALVPRETDAP